MKNPNVAFTVTPTAILGFLNGATISVGKDHPNFGRIKDAIQTEQYDTIFDLADTKKAVRNFLSNNKDFELKGDQIHLDGLPFSHQVTRKVLSMIEAGMNAEPLYNFLRKVRNNPSKTAQDELLLFCDANGFMIHEDGDILAYKSVRATYFDHHSGTVPNKPAQAMTAAEKKQYPLSVTNGVKIEIENGFTVVSMNRGQVDDRRENTCSRGLHFASHNYATTWAGSAGKLLIMKINPADVVSIPSDYRDQKGRCSRYLILAEIPFSSKLETREVFTNADVQKSAVHPVKGVTTNDAAAILDKENTIDMLYGKRRAITKKSILDRPRGWKDSLKRIDDRIAELQDEIDSLVG